MRLQQRLVIFLMNFLEINRKESWKFILTLIVSLED